MNDKEIYEFLMKSETLRLHADKFDFFKITEFKKTLTEESDRGCALMAVSYVELELGNYISSYLVKDSKLKKKLFGGFGPLSTFSSRIDIAYSVGLIPKLMRRDLHILRKIRNEFAHDPRKFGFEKAAISDKCRELYYDALKYDGESPRDIFSRCAVAIALYMHAAQYEVERANVKEDINFAELFSKLKSVLSEIKSAEDT